MSDSAQIFKFLSVKKQLILEGMRGVGGKKILIKNTYIYKKRDYKTQILREAFTYKCGWLLHTWFVYREISLATQF